MHIGLDLSIFSLLSLVVALATGLAAHHYFRRAERQRDEDIIHNTLVKYARCRADVTALTRERNKTGQPFADYELELFTQFELLSTMAEKLERSWSKSFHLERRLRPKFEAPPYR